MKSKFILDLFALTGNASQPYREAGYEVVQIDKQTGTDILTWNYRQYAPDSVYGIMAACPCTAYAGSGARWWAAKDASGETEYFNSLVRKTLEIVDYFRPGLYFWYVENPVGRIDKCVPELAKYRRLLFHPCDYGDPYTKKTILWGEFNPWLIQNRVYPSEGSKMHRMAPGPERQNLRSATPMGFSRAFFNANQ